MASDGAEGNGASGYTATSPELGVAISGDGRHVAFVSAASNMVAGDTNDADDVFVRDICLGGDSRFVSFTSYASNLVPGGVAPPGTGNIFVAPAHRGPPIGVSQEQGRD